MSPLVELRDVSVSFGPTRALDDVSFAVRAGEVHVLAGENGAGKSTLIRVLSGVITTFDGELFVAGERARFRDARDAAAHGVATIHQELSLVGSMTVAENLALPRPGSLFGLVSAAEEARAARRVLAEMDLDLDPSALVETLPLATRQLLEIARALAQNARVLILDEPTSALSEPEADRLLTRVERLAEAGHGIVYVSHRMEENDRVAHHITVLRDGRVVASRPAKELPPAELVAMMMGERANTKSETSPAAHADLDAASAATGGGSERANTKSETSPGAHANLDPITQGAASGGAASTASAASTQVVSVGVAGVRGLRGESEPSGGVPGRGGGEGVGLRDEGAGDRDGEPPLFFVRELHVDVAGVAAVRGVSFSVAKGEILGLAGLRGAGASEVLAGLFGVFGAAARAEVVIGGAAFVIESPARSIEQGVVLLSNDRKKTVFGDLAITENVTLSSLARLASRGVLDLAGEERVTAEATRRLRVAAPSTKAAARALSGGNQQKVALLRCVAAEPRVLLLDEPTRGVDVGAKAEIHRTLRALAAEGKGLVVITSELGELIELCDRVLVLSRGRASATLEKKDFSRERLRLALDAP